MDESEDGKQCRDFHLQKIVQSRILTCKWECDIAAFYLYLKSLESLEGGKQTGWKMVRFRRERVGRIAPKLCMEGIKSNKPYEKLSFFARNYRNPAGSRNRELEGGLDVHLNERRGPCCASAR